MKTLQKVLMILLGCLPMEKALASSHQAWCEQKEITADYIIVGTGAAGGLLARLLTDDMKTSVLALEAGDNNDADQQIYDSNFAMGLEPNYFPQYFWQATNVLQRHINNREIHFTNGRLLGGGSSINTLQYVRPTKKILEKWQEFAGDAWSPENALEHFKALENYNGLTNNEDAHGYNGMLHIRQAPAEPTQMALDFVHAVENALHIDEILDYNDPNTPIGPFARWSLFQKPDRTRASSSLSFLTNKAIGINGCGLSGRKLKVSVNSTAMQVIWDNNKAAGVTYLQDGVPRKAYAKKGVIVSAGIHTPEFLMHSGVGPGELLRARGIDVKYDNGFIGNQLANHYLVAAAFSAPKGVEGVSEEDPESLYVGGAFLPGLLPGRDVSDRGYQLIGVGSAPQGHAHADVRVKPLHDGPPVDQPNSFAIIALDLNAYSRGILAIQNDDPLKIPLVDEEILEHPLDVESFVHVFKSYIFPIADALHDINEEYVLLAPARDSTDDQLREYIKETVDHAHHYQSMCRMAPESEGGVCDGTGKVYGVKNLYVVDDNLIPQNVDGNTCAPAYLIASTIAKSLLENN